MLIFVSQAKTEAHVPKQEVYQGVYIFFGFFVATRKHCANIYFLGSEISKWILVLDTSVFTDGMSIY